MNEEITYKEAFLLIANSCTRMATQLKALEQRVLQLENVIAYQRRDQNVEQALQVIQSTLPR